MSNYVRGRVTNQLNENMFYLMKLSERTMIIQLEDNKPKIQGHGISQ